jgi:exonuclease III
VFEILTWNVAGRVARCDEQIALVAQRAADIACLQELTPSTIERWTSSDPSASSTRAARWRCVHSPTSPKPERAKVRTLLAMHAAALGATEPMVIAGDLNTPRYESREGEITSFARTRTGNLRPALGAEHDRAELALIKDLPEHGWHDAFRSLHGYERRDRSWVAARGYGYRLDHIIVSPQLEVAASDYLHEWRDLGGSDHAAMWARLRLPARPE